MRRIMTVTLDTPSTTFIFGIESGYFESQTILAVECLRRFGGRFANAPILAIRPRFGPDLTQKTLQKLEKLGVQVIQKDMKHPYSWYCYMNKALAAMIAEEYATTEQIIWLDSDTLIVSEPEQLWLPSNVDFAICSTDKNVGTSGPGDKNEAYWQALCDYYKVSIDQLPFVQPEYAQEPVRFRLHSGVYVYRRGLGLGKAFLDACEKMIESRIGYSESLVFPGDDVALAFAVVLLNLRWITLPKFYNFEVIPSSYLYRRSELSHTKVIHYHYCLTKSDACHWLMNEVKEELPAMHQFLMGKVPLNAKLGGLHRSTVRALLKHKRKRQQHLHELTCKKFVMS
jgi:hypothetical protein